MEKMSSHILKHNFFSDNSPSLEERIEYKFIYFSVYFITQIAILLKQKQTCKTLLSNLHTPYKTITLITCLVLYRNAYVKVEENYIIRRVLEIVI